MGTIFLYEIAGTAALILLGVGVVANHVLARTGGHGGGPLMIHWGWGLGVYAGVWIAYKTGAHLNPAVTLGLWASGASEYADGIPVTFANTIAYLLAQLIGAMIGALLAYLAYKKHYDATEDPAAKLGTFCTAPGIRAYGWNLLTEIVATFVLVLVILMFGSTPQELGPLAVALLVVGIGASLGGPTGYAINSVRDLGPRLVHALLPMRNKGGSDWSYAWVPVLGPVIGGILAGIVSRTL